MPRYIIGVFGGIGTNTGADPKTGIDAGNNTGTDPCPGAEGQMPTCPSQIPLIHFKIHLVNVSTLHPTNAS